MLPRTGHNLVATTNHSVLLLLVVMGQLVDCRVNLLASLPSCRDLFAIIGKDLHFAIIPRQVVILFAVVGSTRMPGLHGVAKTTLKAKNCRNS